MHNAPSVNYPVGRSRFALGIALTAWAAGATACALWWWQVQPAAWRASLVAVSVLGAGLWGWSAWLRGQSGTLAWTGQGWEWNGQEGTPCVSVDLQRWLVVHWRGNEAHCWLCLDRSASPARWDDLRRAVYSRARPDALPGV